MSLSADAKHIRSQQQNVRRTDTSTSSCCSRIELLLADWLARCALFDPKVGAMIGNAPAAGGGERAVLVLAVVAANTVLEHLLVVHHLVLEPNLASGMAVVEA